MSSDGWNGEALGYAVSWRSVDDGEDGAGTSVARGAAASALLLTGLPPVARFDVTVRALSRAGLGPPAPSVSATTLDTGECCAVSVRA